MVKTETFMNATKNLRPKKSSIELAKDVAVAKITRKTEAPMSVDLRPMLKIENS